jgi:hypothetical protein
MASRIKIKDLITQPELNATVNIKGWVERREVVKMFRLLRSMTVQQ